MDAASHSPQTVVMKILKAIGVLLVLWFVAGTAVIFYMRNTSSRFAHGFCDSIRLNEDFTSLDLRAKKDHARHIKKTDKDGTEEHHFWVSGVFDTMSMCSVVISNGKVISKQVDD